MSILYQSGLKRWVPGTEKISNLSESLYFYSSAHHSPLPSPPEYADTACSGGHFLHLDTNQHPVTNSICFRLPDKYVQSTHTYNISIPSLPTTTSTKGHIFKVYYPCPTVYPIGSRSCCRPWTSEEGFTLVVSFKTSTFFVRMP
jgi:hypothetical protein